jgi:C-terminal processing protease CtpA/Prc
MSIHKDEHLSLRFNPDWIKNERGRKALDEAAILLQNRRDRASNYGFQEIRILPANIGYLKLNSFSYNTDAYDAAVGAMSFLSNADALIIDLRTNGGGSPEMVQFLCSYFLANPRQHLNSFSYKDKEKLTQYWTYTYLPGKRLDKTDLYLLTSENTFSAAEEFTYNLKNLKRAVVIGVTTGRGGPG